MATIPISEGARALLKIAVENDKKSKIAKNTCLKLCLEALKALPGEAQKGEESFFQWYRIKPEEVQSFLGLCARMLHYINERVGESKSDSIWPDSTDFDHAILLGLAQTLSEVAMGDDDTEPKVSEALDRFSSSNPRILQKMLIANYVGNLLQDYFDECGIRLKEPTLSPETEEDLRYDDGAGFVDYLFEEIDPNGQQPVETTPLQKGLHKVFKEIGDV